MKKRYVFSLVSLLGLAAFQLGKKKFNTAQKNNSFAQSIEKAGIPDQMDIKTPTQLENSNMVSEGSQFGVQYFNEIAEEQIQR